jgi:hypothetical protein
MYNTGRIRSTIVLMQWNTSIIDKLSAKKYTLGSLIIVLHGK